jgi:dTDP-3-amino-3,4,6-trideoxy-alpha-D-glucose transaminase
VTVPFLDVGAAYRELREPLDAAIRRTMESGIYIGGDEVEAFEIEFAAFCGTEHCVAVGNGLDALTIALAAHGVGPGDEVVVPAHTFVATWLAVTRLGATVVAVDVDPATLLIDVAAVRAAIGPRTAAILPVHLYGDLADMTALTALAAARGLLVLEDAAQAHGARRAGEGPGRLGDAAGFSFYPAKNLGAVGDGGALVCDDEGLAARARRLRSYGAPAADRYRYLERGVNSRLDPVQAAVLRVKLAVLEEWNDRRRRIAAIYRRGLTEVAELVLPAAPAGDELPACHLFCVRHPRRDGLAAHLARAGVATQVHYPVAPHRSPAFAELGLGPGSFPVAEGACATLLSLPIGPHLSEADAERVVAAVRSFSG